MRFPKVQTRRLAEEVVEVQLCSLGGKTVPVSLAVWCIGLVGHRFADILQDDSAGVLRKELLGTLLGV